MLKDYFSIAFGNLTKRFLRTSLTMIGIFIGVAAVVALVSLGQGMQEAINAQFATVGTDKIIIQGASAGFGPPGQNTAGNVGKHDLQIVKNTQGVMRAAGRLLKQSTVDYAKETQTIFTASLPETQEERNLVIEANNLKIAQGRMLKQGEKKHILVGNNLWTKTGRFPKKIELGTKLKINSINFEVAGLLEKIGSGRDDMIIMNEEDMREMLAQPEQYSALFAQTIQGEEPSKVADKITRSLRRDRHQKEGFEDFTVQTSENLIASVNTIIGVVQAVFAGIAAISLLVGGIGIMNTMYTSVLERTKDIGVMKAIGARNKDIFMLFLIESGLLGMSGGTVGIITGAGMSKIVEILASETIGSLLKATFPWQLIAGTLTFTFIIGAVSGIMPARQASKMQPAEALRYD
ncbi:ABC transporter permease [Candidatus Woesearchaeota archaeon]|nr:ABC transporter permease [Candidatus Woesearchaeota archaeon]